MRLIFMGTPAFSVPALRAIAARHDVVAWRGQCRQCIDQRDDAGEPRRGAHQFRRGRRQVQHGEMREGEDGLHGPYFSGETAVGRQIVLRISARQSGPPFGGQMPRAMASARIASRSFIDL